MNKKEAFEEINKLQNEYVNELASLITNSKYSMMKTINFTSPTGTGKTKMMSKLINLRPEYYYIITTLSKGQLHYQIRDSIQKDCNTDNFTVYGSADYRINSKLDAEDIIGKIPNGKQCIWLRDEGHIKTNRFDELLRNVCFKVINFSATNIVSDIQCKFSQTMMLRTVNQGTGTPEDAINKLIEVKEAHKNIKGYNPCAIFRCVAGNKTLYNKIINVCRKNKLKYIDITDDEYVMSQLCEDDNKYDVIINKFKIVEGIDIRRAHVIYMDNQPSNNITTIQLIGRCRRNALLYRDDIDILDDKNQELLEKTRECYVFYNVENMKIDTDIDGELQYAFCNHISCEALCSGTSIEVINGQLPNGLNVIELEGKTGKYNIHKDVNTGFNVIDPIPDFYDCFVEKIDDNYLYTNEAKIRIENVPQLRLFEDRYYKLNRTESLWNVPFEISNEIISLFKQYKKKYTKSYIYSQISDKCIDVLMAEKFEVDNTYDYEIPRDLEKGNNRILKEIENLADRKIDISKVPYRLGEVCLVSEINMLKVYLLKNIDKYRNERKLSNFLVDFLQLKKTYFSRRYINRYTVSNIYKGKNLHKLDSEKMNAYVDGFVKKNWRKKEYKEICSFIKTIHYSLSFDHIFDNYEITQIKYICVKETEKGISYQDIIEHINEIKEFCRKRYIYNEYAESPKFTEIVLQGSIKKIIDESHRHIFSVMIYDNNSNSIDSDDVERYFEKINSTLETIKNSQGVLYMNSERIISDIIESLKETEESLVKKLIPHVTNDFSSLFEELTEEEKYLVNKGFIESVYRIEKSDLSQIVPHKPYVKIVNDRESSLIGVDMMRQFKDDSGEVIWTESRAVTSKISSYNKLNSFITLRYSDELIQAEKQYVRGKNEFALDTKCNSMLGYCVEYYSKYLVYGANYLKKYIDKALAETYTRKVTDSVIIRACMMKYKEMMVKSFGVGVGRIITGLKLESLNQDKYKYFVGIVSELGKKTAKYVKKTLYPDGGVANDIDPNLSIRHIAGLADYITSDTILDIKVRNNIDERCVRQVLAYHYLSTKRSDLRIKRVIVYDAVSGKSVVVNISDSNILIDL